ncbi:hypothetical protein ACQCN2_13980 [Brevibacillus ginsengisoli]|uniref:hypothetical protein n=1 Tax=Brevibacillus ginsengisoli TaxID=363854 RepID=UPI003CF48986
MMQLEKFKLVLLAGILVCLFFIAKKPEPVFYNEPPNIQLPQVSSQSTHSSDTIAVPLAPNRIALIDTREGSNTYGKIIVMEYDAKTKQLLQVSSSAFSFHLEFGTPK